jgi:hypothetical protein
VPQREEGPGHLLVRWAQRGYAPFASSLLFSLFALYFFYRDCLPLRGRAAGSDHYVAGSIVAAHAHDTGRPRHCWSSSSCAFAMPGAETAALFLDFCDMF